MRVPWLPFHPLFTQHETYRGMIVGNNYCFTHSLSQIGQAIHYLRDIGTHRLYTSFNRSALIAAAAERLAYN